MDRSAKTLVAQHAWIFVGLVGMVSVALSSGLKPWAAAVAGAFVPADFAADAAAAHLFAQAISPYGPVIRTAHMDLTGLPFVATLPYFPHPPFSLLISFPAAFLSFHASALVWFGVTMALIFALAVLLNESGPTAVRIGVAPLWVLLLTWPPVLYNLEKGQWSVLIAVLLALSWRAVERHGIRSSAIWAAVAASVKVFPVVLGVYFVLRSVRAAGWFVGTGVLLACLPLLWIGFDAFPAFIGESRLNLPYWETFPLVMFSIHGAVTRALVGGQWAEPFVHAPTLAAAVELAIIGSLLGLAIWTTLRTRQGGIDPSMALLVWMVLLPMLNPLALGHNGVLLGLPIVVLARKLTMMGRDWHRWAWSAALALVSIPNQTVWHFAAPPTGPMEGLMISALPAWGTLLLFTVAVSVARSGTPLHEPITHVSGKLITSPPASTTVYESIGRPELTRSKG